MKNILQLHQTHTEITLPCISATKGEKENSGTAREMVQLAQQGCLRPGVLFTAQAAHQTGRDARVHMHFTLTSCYFIACISVSNKYMRYRIGIYIYINV